MIPSPWRGFVEPEPDREYLVLLTHLPLTRYRSLPRFLTYTRKITGQLERALGLVGYSLKAQPLRKKFWTLSAWEDETALRAFTYAGSHREAMVGLRGEMGPTRFTRWTVLGRDLPPAWEDALARQAEDEP